jgi:hypothetical protein
MTSFIDGDVKENINKVNGNSQTSDAHRDWFTNHIDNLANEEKQSFAELLLRNDYFKDSGDKVVNTLTISQIIDWKLGKVKPALFGPGSETFPTRAKVLEMLILFTEEIRDYCEGQFSAFDEYFIELRDQLLSLSNKEISILYEVVKLNGVLHPQVQNMIMGKPFFVELPKTGGYIFFYRTEENKPIQISQLVPDDGFEAWVTAHDLAIPVTPIALSTFTERKEVSQKYSNYQLVDTRMVGWQVSQLLASDFWKEIEPEFEKQRNKITKKLEDNSIFYVPEAFANHNREHNYYIEFIDKTYFEQNGGWESINNIPYDETFFAQNLSILNDDNWQEKYELVVRLTDWDHASLTPFPADFKLETNAVAVVMG